MRKPRSRPLRRRVLTSIVGLAALAVALFAVPLGYAQADGYHNQSVTDLQREATRVAATVSDSFGTDRSTVTLPADLPRGLSAGVYRIDGTRIALAGPAHSALAAAAVDGHLHDRVEAGDLAVSAPVPSDGGVTLAVRVGQPDRELKQRTLRAWALMLLLAAAVVGAAAVLARWQAAQIARPLEQLTANARALGAGDFTIGAGRSGIDEADAAGVALEATARRLGSLLARERAFSADVSHQLRTPLTALLLGLESDLGRPDADLRASAERTLRRAEQLRTIVDDLLGLARDTHPDSGPLDVAGLLDEVRDRWHGPFADEGRRLTLTPLPELPPVTASAAAVRQIVDVLLDNALRHGSGTATVAVTDVGTGVSIEVGDEGPGIADPEQAFVRRGHGPGHGIGLALARTLAEAEGGRLVVRRAAPAPVLSLLLPAEPDQDPAADVSYR
ncbi:MAG: hypothetical protein V7603_3255 [Micromonosporaceae bacterium]